MVHYLITYTHGENLFSCATYITPTLKEAKRQFREEFAGERFYIVQIQILERFAKIA